MKIVTSAAAALAVALCCATNAEAQWGVTVDAPGPCAPVSLSLMPEAMKADIIKEYCRPTTDRQRRGQEAVERARLWEVSNAADQLRRNLPVTPFD
jgi:hypothetical protein